MMLLSISLLLPVIVICYFSTNFGKAYRIKGYELPEGGRSSKGQHIANVLAFQQDERITQVLDADDFSTDNYFNLATERGFVKETPF